MWESFFKGCRSFSGGAFDQKGEELAQPVVGVGAGVEVDGDSAERGVVALANGRSCPPLGVSRFDVLVALDSASSSSEILSIIGLPGFSYPSVGDRTVRRYPSKGISFMQTALRVAVADGRLMKEARQGRGYDAADPYKERDGKSENLGIPV